MKKAPTANPRKAIPAGLSKMTLRERWVRTMHFQKADRLPCMEFGYWTETLPAWHAQGLPPDITKEAEAYAYFGIEYWPLRGPVVGLFPSFKTETIENYKFYLKLKREMFNVGDLRPHYEE